MKKQLRGKSSIEDYILAGIAIVLILFIVYWLTGCATSQKIAEYDVLWSDGKCLFHAKGMSIDQAKEMRQQWNFEDCDIKVEGSDDSTPETPE